VVRQLRARRLDRAVTVRDWDEIRPHRVLEASSSEDAADPEVAGRCEFPGRDEGNVDTPDQAPAQLRLERQSMERELADGHGNARILTPGLRFTLHDESGLREDEDLVVTAIESYATQRKPEALALDEEPFGFSGSQVIGQYENRFSALPAHVVFRPAIATTRPRVQGVHAAVVSADEMRDGPEIHCNADGWVRLRFPWDQRREKDLPSSCWVRASQGWAGLASVRCTSLASGKCWLPTIRRRGASCDRRPGLTRFSPCPMHCRSERQCRR
jgi:type VI secretion system secreted protein VgrG